MAQMRKESSFYPNECFVCQKRIQLKRCSRCQMISYCGEEHQRSDWKSHKKFCYVIFELLKKMNISHIYEKSRGCSLNEWKVARQDMTNHVDYLMDHKISIYEKDMLLFPRCCFVCYSTRQKDLTNCSRCPLVSFCKNHPRSDRHDIMCSEYKECHYLVNEYNKVKLTLPAVVSSIVAATPMKVPQLPHSIYDFFEQNSVLRFEKDDCLETFISSSFSIPLTLFFAIRKLNLSSLPKMSFHVSGFPNNQYEFKCWEIILHLFPDLVNLTVVLYDLHDNFDSTILVCQRCASLGKKVLVTSLSLTIEKQIIDDLRDPPTLSAFFNLEPLNEALPFWETVMSVSTQLRCPLIITQTTENFANSLFQQFNSSSWKPLICYKGKNDFGSLWSFVNWEHWGISKPSQFLLILKAPKPSFVKENTDFCQNVELKENERQVKRKILKDTFYTGICHVCKEPNSPLACKRCKMIFYCGEIHMNNDFPEHREICNVILNFLKRKRTPHLYDNLKTVDEKAWLYTKHNFISEAKLKLKRDLLDFEEQIFLFPKICFICRESDLSFLETCKCGTSLCKTHRDDPLHQILCISFFLNLLLGINKDIPEMPTIAAVPLTENKRTLPPSFESFINSYIKFQVQNSSSSIQNVIKMLVTHHMTRPLTFIYALEKLNICIPKTMIIHIIGATDEEVHDEGYWRIVSYWLNTLQSLTIVFIGIELYNDLKSDNDPLTFINPDAENGKTLDFKTIPASYDKFFTSSAFSKPNMVIGYNLDLDRNGTGMVESNWLEALCVIKVLDVPFLLTAKSEKRARADHALICSTFDKAVKYEFCEQNPYNSFVPERDYQTERICFSNNYVIGYKKFTKTEAGKKAISKVENVNFEDVNNCKKSNNDEHLKDEPRATNREENKIRKENLRLRAENRRLKEEILRIKIFGVKN